MQKHLGTDMSTLTENFPLGETSDQWMGYVNANNRGSGTVGGKENLTIDMAGHKLSGYDEDTGKPHPAWGAVGQPFNLTYAFRSSAPSTMPADTSGFERFNAAQITQAEQALLAWSDVSNIRLTRVGSGTTGDGAYSNNASLLLGGYNKGPNNLAAFAYQPGSTAATALAGDVWVNSTSSGALTPAMGNYAGQVLIHEIGHALGLNHPGDYDATDGVPFTYANDGEYFQDSRQYTVMSYFAETNTGANFGGRYASTPLLDDIRGAQIEYGANMSTRTGDTVYGFGSTAERAWFLADSPSTKLVFAVWDAGGNDTFNFSGFAQAQNIDLHEGYFSDVGGLIGNVAIAQGVKIENAIGGSGDDTITGNALDNRLEGGLGNDRIKGEAGGDTIFGGAGDDTIDGGDGRNLMFGEDGDDYIFGGLDADTINGNAGSDTITGGLGADVLLGGRDNDYLFGDDGADFMNGNLGDDTVTGGAGADTLLGGQGDDLLSGGSGNDYLSGDRGNDTLVGGAGADRFRVHLGMGLDQIKDFVRADGDQLVLDAGLKYAATQSGYDIVVVLEGSPDDRMTLLNAYLVDMTNGWIVSA